MSVLSMATPWFGWFLVGFDLVGFYLVSAWLCSVKSCSKLCTQELCLRAPGVEPSFPWLLIVSTCCLRRLCLVPTEGLCSVSRPEVCLTLPVVPEWIYQL